MAKNMNILTLSDAIFNSIGTMEGIPASILSEYNHWAEYEESLGMNIMHIHGNGLCWINGNLASVFGEFRTHPPTLNKWLSDLLTTMVSVDETFTPCLDIFAMEIKYVNGSLVDFLDANNDIMFVLAHNIIAFCIKNYSNPSINIGCERPVDLEVCIGFDKKMGGFKAIDCNMRNFIMNIMGIQTVIVYQKRTEPKYRRGADPQNRVSQILRNGFYAGFQIDSFGTINIGGYIGSIMLYSYNANHYDAIIVHHEGIDKLGMFQSVDNPVEQLTVFNSPSSSNESSLGSVPGSIGSVPGSIGSVKVSEPYPDTSFDEIIAKTLAEEY
jgi:hypothetical protein